MPVAHICSVLWFLWIYYICANSKDFGLIYIYNYTNINLATSLGFIKTINLRKIFTYNNIKYLYNTFFYSAFVLN